jgi:hypothetical protein
VDTDYEKLKHKCDLVIHGLESLNDDEMTRKFFKIIDDFTLDLRSTIMNKMLGDSNTK